MDRLKEIAKKLDSKDNLSKFREKFILPKDKIYLDGNSLGVLAKDIIDEINHIIFLIGGRWVGIEGVMVLINNENKSFELLKKSLNEKFALSNSFYENEIKKSYFKYSNPKNHKAYTVYTPGIVGYLYYSGSLFFIFFGIFVCASICNLIEFLAYKLSDNSYVFTAIIGNILAYRLIHFGYMPSNTYKILLAILLNFLLIIVMYKLVDLFYKK